eukprot:6837322-Prymnesium_polylepis.1
MRQRMRRDVSAKLQLKYTKLSEASLRGRNTDVKQKSQTSAISTDAICSLAQEFKRFKPEEAREILFVEKSGRPREWCGPIVHQRFPALQQ